MNASLPGSFPGVNLSPRVTVTYCPIFKDFRSIFITLLRISGGGGLLNFPDMRFQFTLKVQ